MQLLYPTLLVLAASSAHAHIKMLNVVGANGVTGTAFALQPGTVSDNGGLALKKFEGDTTIFSRAGTSGCGRTENSGQLDCAQQAQAQLSASGGGLPTCSSSGEIAVTMHQVNQDGAGPLKAFIDTTGTGQNFQKATVTNNVPGIGGLSLAVAKDFNVKVQMPAGASCNPMCLVRLQNPIGPFGGTAAFTDDASGNKTAAAREMLPQRMLQKRIAAKVLEFRKL